MKIIQLVDPTQKKTEKPVAASAPAAAPAAVAAPVQDDSEVIAVIAAAVAALGHSAEAYRLCTSSARSWLDTECSY